MKPSLLSAARKAELLARYPAEDTAALAKEFGLLKRQVRNLASNNEIGKAGGDGRTSEGTFSQQVLAALTKAGPAGLSRADAIAALPQLRAGGVCNALHNLTNRERIFRAGNTGHSRWFARAEWADEHTAQALRLRSAWPCMDGVHIKHPTAPAHLPGEAIVPEGVKPITGPTVPGPAARLASTEPGVFSLLGPGRYVAEAPKWVEAITSKDKAA